MQTHVFQQALPVEALAKLILTCLMLEANVDGIATLACHVHPQSPGGGLVAFSILHSTGISAGCSVPSLKKVGFKFNLRP